MFGEPLSLPSARSNPLYHPLVLHKSAAFTYRLSSPQHLPQARMLYSVTRSCNFARPNCSVPKIVRLEKDWVSLSKKLRESNNIKINGNKCDHKDESVNANKWYCTCAEHHAIRALKHTPELPSKFPYTRNQ